MDSLATIGIVLFGVWEARWWFPIAYLAGMYGLV